MATPKMVDLATRMHRDDDEARRRSLEQRLDDGYRRIEAARAAGQDIDAWETFWIQLLDEYVELCDRMAGLPEAA